MSTKSSASTYSQVVKVTHTYLGPAAERFIDRQVENHLHKQPSKLTKADLVVLIDWIRVIVSLITEDTEIVEEYISELHKLSVSSKDSRE
jgi:hypothetical protein